MLRKRTLAFVSRRCWMREVACLFSTEVPSQMCGGTGFDEYRLAT